MEIVTYANDIAVITKGPVTYMVGELLEEAADTIVGWLEVIGVELALEKTELLLSTRKRTYNTLQVTVRGHTVTSASSGKYQGVQLDQKANFKAHTAAVTERADKANRALRAIMPNLRGPKQHVRKLLMAVLQSILLYGSSIWSHRMLAGGWKLMHRSQRRTALRVATAYRTVSSNALLDLAGIPSIDLAARERTYIYIKRNGGTGTSARPELQPQRNRWRTGRRVG